MGAGQLTEVTEGQHGVTGAGIIRVGARQLMTAKIEKYFVSIYY